MLTIKKIGNAGDAQHYYTSKDNYYLSDRESLNSLSTWMGKGSQKLELSGMVNPEQFLKLLHGELPNGQLLGAVENGARKHRPGTDVTLSAPKSVSILALVGKDERLLKAHQEAVEITFNRIEQLAAEARVTFNKETVFEKTGNLIAASFIHTTSRDLDPDLHTHLAILNMTERSDGQWRALSSRAKSDKEHLDNGFRELIYTNQHYLGLVYTASLAKKVAELGYSLRIKDRYGNFEIEGISDDCIKATSKRREGILNDMKERGTASARAAEMSNLSTRKPKMAVDSQALHTLWEHEIATHNINLAKLIESSRSHKGEGEIRPIQNEPVSPDAKSAIHDAIEHLSEYSTKIQHGLLVRQAMIFSGGKVPHEHIEQEIESLLSSKSLQGKHLEYYTSAKLLEKEKTFIQNLAMGSKTSPFGDSDGYGLASQIFKSSERIHIIDVNGFHTEKDLIQNMVDLSSKHHINPYVLHPGRLKTLQLKEDIKHPEQSVMAKIRNLFKDDIVHTVSGFQYQYGKKIHASPWTKNKQNLIIVHDAQKLSLQDISSLNELTKDGKGRLVLLNNASSTLGFSAGNPIKLLKENGVESHTSLNRAIKGNIQLAASIQPREAMISEWLTIPPEERKNNSLIALSNTQKNEINERVREKLTARGELSRQSSRVSVLSALSLTETEKNRSDSYQIGDRITFFNEKNSSGHFKVRDKLEQGLLLENKFGQQKRIIFGESADYRVSRVKEMDIAVGEQLINDQKTILRQQKFEARSAFTVTKISEEGLYLQHQNRTLFVNYETLSEQYFSYDYCKKPQELSEYASNAYLCAESYQLSRNLIGEIGEHAKNLTVFTNEESKARKFMEQAQLKWTALDVQERKPDMVYRDMSFANKAVEQELSRLIEHLELAPQDKKGIAETALHYALTKCAERNAAFKHTDLMTHALQYALGKADFEDIAPLLQKRMSEDLVYLDTYWTTQEALKLEESILKANMTEQNTVSPIESNQNRLLSLPDTLTQGQKDAISLVTTTSDRFVTIQGLAGVGKTTMMRHVKTIAEEHQFKVLGLAPTHKAVEELNANNIASQTIDSFLQNEIPIDSQYLLIVDESSMIDNEKYYALQQKCIDAKARIVFTGDITQLQTLSSGIPHELAVKTQTQKVARMEEIVRQNPNPELKKAAELSSKRKVGEALDVIKNINPEAFVERRGSTKEENSSSIIEVDCKNEGKKDYTPIYEAISQDFLSRTKDCQDNTLIIVHAHEDRTPIEIAIREGLKQQDRIRGTDTMCGRLFAKNIDKADVVLAASYEAGDIIRFGKTYSVAKKGAYFTISKVDTKTNKLFCTDESNHTFTINTSMLPKTMPSFYKCHERPLADGDRVRLKLSDKSRGFTANEEYTVKNVIDKKVVLQNEKNTLTLDLNEKTDQHWDYAYTNTAYSSQGATKKYIIALELEDRVVVTTHRSHEIDVTRASHQATIYTDNLAGLVERLEDPHKQRDADKTSALLTDMQHRLKQEKLAAIQAIVKEKSHNEAEQKEPSAHLGTKYHYQAQQHAPIDAQLVYKSLASLTEPLLKNLLGEPNANLSTHKSYRYGTKGSLKIDLNSGLWHNFETEESGNLFHLIEREQGFSDFKDTLEYAARFVNHMPEYTIMTSKTEGKLHKDEEQEREGKRKFAQALFQKSQPIKGTLAEKYLVVHRGLNHYHHADLRYCPSVFSATQAGKNTKSIPALMAVSRDEDGAVHHVQVIKLDPKTANKDKSLEPVKQTFGSIQGHYVTLNSAGKGNVGYLTEGIETGLSILEVHKDAPVYAVLGKANFAKIHPDKLPEKIVLCIDNDGDETYKYAKNEQTNTVIKAAERLIEHGIKVSILMPKNENSDFNDTLVKQGMNALKAELAKGISLSDFKEKCAEKNKTQLVKINDKDEKILSLLKNDGKRISKSESDFTRVNQDLVHRTKERINHKILENAYARESIQPIANREMEREL
ncbi:TPA: conjugative transfer relaxase/helicase TraI [Legionella pneumophila]|nr:conjugative transfer relaxase/helicase TraI [Legionella pneumophila]